MAEPAASTSATDLVSSRRRAVDLARDLVVGVAGRLAGLDRKAAQRNAWEAVCADRERRRQWDEAWPGGTLAERTS